MTSVYGTVGFETAHFLTHEEIGDDKDGKGIIISGGSGVGAPNQNPNYDFRLDQVGRRLRRKEYPVRKAYAQVEAFSDAELDAAVTRLAAVDLAVKGGSRLPDDLELERALGEITQPAAGPARPARAAAQR